MYVYIRWNMGVTEGWSRIVLGDYAISYNKSSVIDLLVNNRWNNRQKSNNRIKYNVLYV